jgi:hypothetical protein
LATLALTPFLLTIVSGLVLRNPITLEMMVGAFPLLPLLLIELARIGDADRLCRISVRLAVALALGVVVLSPAIALARTYLSAAAMKVEPLEEIAVAATELWHERTGLPVGIVAGSDWYENTAAFYSPDRPSAFVHFNYAQNLWVSPQAIARRGLLSICVRDDRVCLDATARFVTPQTTRAEVTVAREFWGHVARPVTFVVTAVPPASK